MLMFTWTHKRLLNEQRFTHQRQLLASKQAYADLLASWNSLVRRINALGGTGFLDDAERNQSRKRISENSPNQQFTKADIDKLIRLCHPDRHAGSETATEMTQRLLALRKL